MFGVSFMDEKEKHRHRIGKKSLASIHRKKVTPLKEKKHEGECACGEY